MRTDYIGVLIVNAEPMNEGRIYEETLGSGSNISCVVT